MIWSNAHVYQGLPARSRFARVRGRALGRGKTKVGWSPHSNPRWPIYRDSQDTGEDRARLISYGGEGMTAIKTV
jgi:hypothetical protein